MNSINKVVLAGLALTFSSLVFSNDLEGVVESVDQAAQSFKVQGITFYTSENTDYDDGLKQFADIEVDQRLEVDFKYQDGKHYATEIELESNKK
ncbi:MAG: DUF5666 domain-containing protein [Spongiibacteraceae bacterium]